MTYMFRALDPTARTEASNRMHCAEVGSRMVSEGIYLRVICSIKKSRCCSAQQWNKFVVL